MYKKYGLKIIGSYSVLMAVLMVTIFGSRLMAATNLAAKDFGLGVVLGEPTGLSFKSFLTADTGIDGALAWSLGKGSAVLIHGDYHWHTHVLIHNKNFYEFFGLGVRAQFTNQGTLGIRIPLGVSYVIPTAPIEIFGEIAPVVDFVPSTSGALNAGIGARYYF